MILVSPPTDPVCDACKRRDLTLVEVAQVRVGLMTHSLCHSCMRNLANRLDAYLDNLPWLSVGAERPQSGDDRL